MTAVLLTIYAVALVAVFAARLVLRLPAVHRWRTRQTVDTLTCNCAARLPSCVCTIDGLCNPRGAGRGRSVRA